jgi:uncharacterized protein (TIGR00290 family)
VEDVLLSWSGGKDSGLALYEIQQTNSYRIAALLTTVTRDYDRISMHGVRRSLLELQAASLGLPLREIFINKNASNDEYEREFAGVLDSYRAQGISRVVFGDLFLEEIKAYRDKFLAQQKMSGLYPIWKWDTAETVRRFIDLGFKAIVTCVDARVLDGSFAGRSIDGDFLADLPSSVDPCGENGEFHTFVYDGPNFSGPVPFVIGETVERGSFWFCDLEPVAKTVATEI